MNKFLTAITVIAAGLLLMPLESKAQSVRYASQAPPVEQTLVREGDFAVGLAQVLGVGRARSEAEAESDLAARGITPQNGWISDYPVTPRVIDELYEAVAAAADRNNLAIPRHEALRRFDGLLADFALPIRPPGEETYAETQSPSDYGEYSDDTVIHNHYYHEGPPVVTYYSPPPDYAYMYSWVPYPFYWGHFHFTGFYVLRDFHVSRRVVFVNKGVRRARVKHVSNRFFDHDRRKIVRVDSHKRFAKDTPGRSPHKSRSAAVFQNRDARRGAEAILRRDAQRARSAGIGEQRNRSSRSPRFREGPRPTSSRRDVNVRNRSDGERRPAVRNRSVQGVQSERRSGRANPGSVNRLEQSRSRGRENAARSPSNSGRSFRSGGRSQGESRSFNSGRGRSGSPQRSFSRGGGSSRQSFSGGRGRSQGESRSFSSGRGRSGSPQQSFSRGGGSSRQSFSGGRNRSGRGR